MTSPTPNKPNLKDLLSLSTFHLPLSPPMAFNYRRSLLDESEVDPDTTDICVHCDLTRGPDGLCSFQCIHLCPYICPKPPLKPLPPPPPPPLSTVIDFPDPPGKSHRLSLFLTVSLTVLAAAFLLFTCYTIYKFWSQSRRRSQESGPDPDTDPDEFDPGPTVDHPIWYIRTVGLQPSVIGAITIVKYKKGEGIVEGTDCSVCLSEFEEDETLRLLPKCNHAFHLPCIDTWLRAHTNCPMCRAGIVNSAGVLEVVVPVEETRLESESEEVEDESRSEEKVLRRSVSFDSVSGNGSSDSIEVKRGVSESSSGVKRSVSCTAKVFMSRNCSRNRN